MNLSPVVLGQDQQKNIVTGVLTLIGQNGFEKLNQLLASAAVASQCFQVREIVDDRSLLVAQSQLRTVCELIDGIDKSRKELTRPIDGIKSYLIDMAGQAIEPLRNIEKKVKQEMLEYDKRIQESQIQPVAVQQEQLIPLADPSGQIDWVGGGVDRVLSSLVSPEVPVGRPKVKKQTGYDVEVTDLMALVKFVLENPQHIDMINANLTEIKRKVRTTKNGLTIAGVVVTETQTVRK